MWKIWYPSCWTVKIIFFFLLFNFFLGSEEPTAEPTEKPEEQQKADEKPVKEESEQKEKSTDEKSGSTTNETKPEEPTKPLNQTEKTEKKLTTVTLKDPIPASELKHGPQIMTAEKLEKSREKIQILEEFERKKIEKEHAFNNLESFIFTTKQNFELEEYTSAATTEEIEAISKACSETLEWLEDAGFDAEAKILEEKLKYVKNLTDPVYERVYEHRQRPEVINGMIQLLNVSSVFLESMKKAPATDGVFTTIEIETLEKMINETKEYHNTVVKTIEETKLNEPVKYKVRDIANKMALLDREMKYLLNKLKIWKPKVEVGKNDENKTESTSKNATEDVKESSQEGEQVEIPTEEQQEEESNEEESSTVTEDNQPEDHLKEDVKIDDDKKETHQEL